MEYLDIFDENGKPTGKTKSRAEVHRDGDWHKTVHVWIMNSGHEILIQKRSAQVIGHPNMWHISVAGHISAGDDSKTTVLKETLEELGVSIDLKDLEYLFTVKHQSVLNNGTYITNHFNDVYLVLLDLDIAKTKLQPEEVSEIKFIDYQELEYLINNKKINFVEHHEEYSKLFEILHRRYG